MPRRKRTNSPINFDEYDDDLYDDDCSNGSRNPQNFPMYRNAANARERARMRVLSSAFSRLKTKLPWVPADTKLSKLDTLRLATIYIQQLSACLSKNDGQYYSIDVNSHAVNENQPSLVWPFTFQQHSSETSRSAGNINQWINRDPNDMYRPPDTNNFGSNVNINSNNNNNGNPIKNCNKLGTEAAEGHNATVIINNSTAHG